MKVLFLCAGYGTRLQRDVAAQGEQFAHLRHLPKALVPIGCKDALLTDWVDLLRRCSLDDLYLISNDLYLGQLLGKFGRVFERRAGSLVVYYPCPDA